MGRRKEVRGIGIGEELGDDAGLRDDGVNALVLVFDRWNETSLSFVSDACPSVAC